ncbi:MAG: zinc ribbon domain-containing protein [Clostridia bacterium]|nr:zinc ribbon domain-containing protein [Clostridia bacterium]
MFCIKCGKENKSDSKFCVFCGEKLKTEKENATLPHGEFHDCITNTQPICLTNELKSFVRSPIIIIAISLFSIYILSVIAGAGNFISNALDSLEDLFDIDLDFAISKLSGIFSFVALIIMIPNILICVGLWITVYSAFNKTSLSINLSGMKIIKIVNILILIFTLIFCIFSIASASGIIFEALSENTEKIDSITSNSEYSVGVNPPAPQSSFSSPLILFFAILLPFVLFRILYLFKINSTLKSFIKSAENNRAFPGASKFVAVMLIISGILNCLGGLFGISSLSTWCNAGASICFAIIIFKFHSFCLSKIKAI